MDFGLYYWVHCIVWLRGLHFGSVWGLILDNNWVLVFLEVDPDSVVCFLWTPRDYCYRLAYSVVVLGEIFSHKDLLGKDFPDKGSASRDLRCQTDHT